LQLVAINTLASLLLSQALRGIVSETKARNDGQDGLENRYHNGATIGAIYRAMEKFHFCTISVGFVDYWGIGPSD
jgi:hypothetical protein